MRKFPNTTLSNVYHNILTILVCAVARVIGTVIYWDTYAFLKHCFCSEYISFNQKPYHIAFILQKMKGHYINLGVSNISVLVVVYNSM